MWPGERLRKVHTAARRDHVWPEAWINLSSAAQKREKQEWAVEKPKLDNARRMTGIYFVDPVGKEHEEDHQGPSRMQEEGWKCIWKRSCRASNKIQANFAFRKL